MRADIVVGAVFPDYELTDHTGKHRKLSNLQGPGSAPLLARQHPQLGVDSQQFSGHPFEVLSRIDAGTKDSEPVGGYRFDSFFAVHHEGKRGEWMAVALSAVARGFSAASMRNDEGAGKGIGREMKAS